MKKQYKPWEEHLGKRLQDMQGEPAFDAWDRIEAALDDKPKRHWLWLPLSIAAAVAVLLIPAGLWFWQSGDLMPGAAPSLAEQTTVSTEIGSENPHTAPEPRAASTEQIATNAKDLKPGTETSGVAAPKTAKAEKPFAADQSLAGNLLRQTKGTKSNSLAEAKAALATEAVDTNIKTQEAPLTPDKDSDARESIALLETQKSVNSQLDRNQNSIAAGKESALAEESAVAGASTGKISGAPTDQPGISTAIASESNAANEQLQDAENQAEQPLQTIATLTPTSVPAKVEEEAPVILPEMEKPVAVVREKTKKQSLLSSIWLEAQPTMSYSRVEPSKTDGIIITSLNSDPALSTSRLGGQLAAGISYPIMKSLNWKSGAYYWFQQQRISYTYHNAQPDSYVAQSSRADQLSFSATHFEQTHTIEETFHNVGLSTGISYKLPTKFVSSFLDTDAQVHYNAHQKISSFLSIGYSIKARLQGKSSLLMGPAMQVQLNNNSSLSPHFEERPITFGFQMGVLLNDSKK